VVAASGQSARQVVQVSLQLLPVVGPRLAVHPGRRVAFEREVGRFESFDRVDMVHQRGEPGLPVALCRLSYAIERAVHVVGPARCPGRVRSNAISLGSRPSLHRLRRRRGFTRSLVRQLPRYYAAIRLPAPLAHRRTPLSFTMRSARGASRRAAEERGISRFPCEMFPRLLGVFDRAGSAAASPKRLHQCGLRPISTAWAPRTARSSRRGAWITRLNTRPARTPVNASPTPSRACTHDSGPP